MQRTLWAAALLSSTVMLSGCGLFSDNGGDPLDVVIKESVPVDFTIDSSKLCPPGEDCSVTPQPSPADVKTPPVEVAVPIDIVQATMNQKLTEVSSRLKSVEIESIDYKVSPNTLNEPTPAVDINLGPFAATKHDSTGVFLLTTIPSVAAKTEKSGTADVSADAQASSSDLFKQLKFAAIPYGQRDVKKGELFPPQGKAKFTLTFNLKFVANPKNLKK